MSPTNLHDIRQNNINESIFQFALVVLTRVTLPFQPVYRLLSLASANTNAS